MLSDNWDNPKLKKDIRILKLKPIDGRPLNDLGLVDKRIFTGGNNLLVKREKNNIWTMSYEKGITPPALKQKFTSFREAVKYASRYFLRRNIEISEIIE